jgi:hypothetical protein
MAEGHREALVEPVGKESWRTVGVKKLEERIAKLRLFGR